MKEMIGYCGYNCHLCAARSDDPALRQKLHNQSCQVTRQLGQDSFLDSGLSLRIATYGRILRTLI